MIYQINKIKNIIQKQEGVTLLLSILVLSAILAISFSIATILFIEIRTSGDLVRTEGAIYAAEGLSEEVLFKLKRKIGGSFVYSNKLGLVTLDTPIESTTTPLVYETVLGCENNTFEKAARLPVYNSDTPEIGSGYGKIKIENFGDANIDAWICQYRPNGLNDFGDPYASSPCSNRDSNEYWINTTGDVVGTAPGIYVGKHESVVSASNLNWSFDTNKQQEIVMFVPGCTTSVLVKLTGYGSDGVTEKPLPLVGETSVTIKANSAGVSRKMRLTVPKE